MTEGLRTGDTCTPRLYDEHGRLKQVGPDPKGLVQRIKLVLRRLRHV